MVLVFTSFLSFGQLSYDFLEPLPPGLPTTETPKKKFHGFYKSFVSERVIEVNENGIFVLNGVVSQVSRQMVRESSSVNVIANYIFGIKEGDSLPCHSDDNFYYFIVPTTEALVDTTSQNILVKISNNSYMLNFSENGTYTPCLFTFMGEELRIQYFDYENETTAFSEIPVAKEADSSGMITKTLKPNIKEFMKIDYSEMFGKETLYKRQP